MEDGMKAISPKVAIVALLAAAAALGSGDAPGWYTVALFVFGLANALVPLAGTRWVRGAAVVASVLGLAWPEQTLPVLVPLLWLMWPPAILVMWSSGRATPEADDAERRRAQMVTGAIIAAVALASFAYRVIVSHRLEQTSALFIGIPALLAILVVFSASPKTATGVACKAVTIGLLVSLLFLGEGILCILMSAPLFYGVAVIIAEFVEWSRDRGRGSHTAYSFLALLAFVPMSLEGVSQWTSLNRDEWVSETRVVNASAAEVEAALVQSPRFDRVLPAFLRLGFPRPTATRIGNETSPRWVIRFRGGEMRIDGIEPREGDLILDLEERRPGLIRWRAAGDDSHMTHFLDWRESLVQWEPIDAHTTRVTWTLRYRRGLDPAWYFAPWERYAAGLAAGYLIESVATP
jgi:hypothetical protein